LIVFIFASAFILDQITKGIVRHTMVLGESIPILGDVVRFTYVENPGMAFGIRIQHGYIFTILSILASLGVLIYLLIHKDEGMLLKGSLACILGGAAGNLIDRVLHQQVVDFLDIGFGRVRWPVFNIADSAVVIGMLILCFHVFIKKEPSQESKPLKSSDNAQ